MESISLQELLAHKEEREYYCRPLLPVDGTMFFAAPPKHFKTIIAFQLVTSLATGKEFFGFKMEKPVERILYIEQEIGIAETRDRMKRMTDYFNINNIKADVRFITRPKQRLSLDMESKGWKKLEEEIDSFRPQIVIFDPFRKMTSKDENSSTEMTKVFANLTFLQETYGFASILIHHSGKPSENRTPGTPESMRGSSEIFAHGDTYGIMVKPSKTDEDIDIHFTFRHAASVEPLRVRFVKDEGVFIQRAKKESEVPPSNKSIPLSGTLKKMRETTI